MKKIISLAAGMCLIGWAANADAEEAAPVWLTSVPSALAKAKADNRPVLVNFTGSDWCPWCIRLHDEVFEKPEFKDYAKKSLVLAIVDFPHNMPQTAAEKKTADELAKKYGVEGFPTVIVINSQGKVIGQLGYMEGGPRAFIAKLEDVELAAAQKAPGPKSAK